MNAAAQQNRPSPPRPTGLILCLLVLGALVVLGGTAVSVALAVYAAKAGTLSGRVALEAAGVFLGACLAGCALWAVSWIVRTQHELLGALGGGGGASVQEAEAPQTETPPAGPVQTLPEPQSAPAPRELLERLDEINENLLLSPERREDKRRRWERSAAEALAAEAEHALGRWDFGQAQEVLDRLEQKVPSAEELPALRRKLQDARARAERADLEHTTARVEEKLAAASYGEAEQIASELAGRYPQSEEASSLLQRVRTEARQYEQQGKARLFNEVEQHAVARRWRKAVETANRFLQGYPNTPEAGQILSTMPTLQDNARLEEVRSYRDRIREHISQGQYDEAVQLARHVVETYPDTAAARELRGQLPRLEQRARGEQVDGR